MARVKRQLEIAGAERPSHPEIESAFELYYGFVEKKAKVQVKLTEHREALILAMKEAGVASYTFIDGESERTISIVSPERIKISARGANAEDDEIVDE